MTARTQLLVALLASTSLASCTSDGRIPGEIAVYSGTTDAAAPLSVSLALSGNHASCGKCDVLEARVVGGVPPYTYEWSDPTLVGPGPHTVCPLQTARYSVVVQDSSGASPGSDHPTSQVSLATALLECTASPFDGGSPALTGLNGCLVLKEGDRVDCTADGVALPGISSTAVEIQLEPGRTYQYTYNQLLPIGIGTPSTVDVYMGMNRCERTQKVFTLTLDSTATQSYCFVPTQAYRYSTAVIHVNGVPLTFGTTPIVCDTCASTSPYR